MSEGAKTKKLRTARRVTKALWDQFEEVVKDNHTGVCVNPLSPKDLADVLEGFINLKYDIKKMSELGVKVVKEKYSWKFELKKLLKLYKSLEN